MPGLINDVRTTHAGAPASVRTAISILRIYKRWLSPLLPSACRYQPTCSVYMMQAIEKYGVWRGLGKGLRRIGRCHPFHQGGLDPVR